MVKMKFFDVVIISLAIGLSIIGLHQSIVLGFGNSYWIFMLTLSLLLWYKVRNPQVKSESPIQKKSKNKYPIKKKVNRK